ncbi:uncharacterized protein B0I36DRAFT_288834 [Microdochium trichocladiopsis]|uniref:cyclin-dependent kinase n=1 Tax=Microdochium trichocladiopsis TaxID=1682393 RepID=A0A9P9BQM8_9PEZI|nr:uncharacterized protein B0I36DRAFT_288834 [Microdochium trichocladiopsis]KAH7031053.1 hypothetical protein B0I36DRAFT_288834 [Microdochium trichocladiopsis]
MRLPVKHYTIESPLVPVINGEPWSHYEFRYRVKYGTSFGVITSRDTSCRQFLMRTISGPDTDEKIQRVRQLCHDNIVKGIEIYTFEPESYILVSEFMPTTIQHVCRSPKYPNELQLSSILFQVLQGLQFLLRSELFYEQLTCANLLISLSGDVKICEVDSCSRSGSFAAVSRSFSKVVMKLMDKEKNSEAVIGLTRPGDWSSDALSFFSSTTTTSSDFGDLLQHPFLQKRKKEELTWLVHYVLITAHHSRA